MRMRLFVGGFTLGCATMLLAATALNTPVQDAEPPQVDPAAMQEMQQMMENMQKFGSPAEQHAELAKAEGEWTVKGEVWMAPGAPAMEFGGNARFTMVMDGRYLMQEVQADMMGETFTGAGLTAFDLISQQYQGLWIDSGSTAIAFQTGQKNDHGDIVYKAKMPHSGYGKYIDVKSVERTVDENTMMFEMYYPGPDGGEYLHMRMTYHRVQE